MTLWHWWRERLTVWVASYLREYRVHLLDDDSRVKAVALIFCATDEEAYSQARRGLEPSEVIEVWDAGRLVSRGDALERHIWQ